MIPTTGAASRSVRAGIVSNPEDYRSCAYVEALSGRRGAKLARAGLGLMLSKSLQDPDFKNDWRRTAARYRLFLYEEGAGSGPRTGTRRARSGRFC